MLKSFAVNAVLIVVKAIGGVLFASAALLADAFHSLSDLMSDILVLIGVRKIRKPADAEHPVGHGKIEYVLSLFLGIGILFIAYQILRNVFIDFGEPAELPDVNALWVVAFVIGVKLILSRYLIARSKVLASQVVAASGKESFMDVLGSLIVFLGVLFSFLGDAFNISILVYADQIAAAFIAALIIRVAYQVINEAIRSVLGKSAPKEVMDSTRDLVEDVKGVRGVDSLTMVDYGHYYQVMVDIRVDETLTVKEGHDIAHEVKSALKHKSNVGPVIVHVNPEVIE